MKKHLSIICFLIIAQFLCAQTSSKPIIIELKPTDLAVAPGERSYVVATFKVPKGIWLGAAPGDARTPPGTSIKGMEMAGFSYEDAIYPEPIEEYVPAKLGKTKVFKELVEIILPFNVDASVKEGTYNLKFKVNYTPGYNAGRLATHTNEVYSTTINVNTNAKSVTKPSPSLGTVSDDFYVKAKSYDDIPQAIKFMFKPLNEDRGGIRGLHKMWLDRPGHGKTVRIMPFPVFSTNKIQGTSLGMGASFLNSTKEGTMTGMFSMSGFYNDLIGGAISLQAISCPGAFHNYQFSAVFGGEGYREVTLHYENFTIANSSIGLDFNFASINEPRMRFYGVGPLSVQENESAYERTNLNGIIDLYSLPVQNLRFGVGISYDDHEAGTSFEELEEIAGIPLLQETSLVDGLLGLGGATSVGFRANIIFDHRDQEFVPSRGFYLKMTGSRNSLSNITEDIADSYYGLDVDMRQYFSGPSQKLVVLMRGALSLKSESNLPYYMLSSLGGLLSSRAYDADRFLDQHAGFLSAEMRYTLLTIPVLGYPMSVEMGAFLDVGQVFGNGVAFGDELNIDPGISMRMINKPNVGLVINYAVGEDGGYLTGGIGLPF